VLELVLLKKDVPKGDAFNFEAARYLKERDWKATPGQYKDLLHHSEDLLRSLAASRLDPAKPEERSLLKEAIKLETNQAVKSQLIRKLMESNLE
jgi:hypothetical protein